MDFILQIIMFLAVFGIIILLSYYTTRLVAKKAGNMMKGNHVGVMETVSLGTDKKLYLIKAGDKYLLLSSSGKNLRLISEVSGIDDEDFEIGDKKGHGIGKDFSLNLRRIKKIINKHEETGDRNRDENMGNM